MLGATLVGWPYHGCHWCRHLTPRLLEARIQVHRMANQHHRHHFVAHAVTDGDRSLGDAAPIDRTHAAVVLSLRSLLTRLLHGVLLKYFTLYLTFQMGTSHETQYVQHESSASAHALQFVGIK